MNFCRRNSYKLETIVLPRASRSVSATAARGRAFPAKALRILGRDPSAALKTVLEMNHDELQLRERYLRVLGRSLGANKKRLALFREQDPNKMSPGSETKSHFGDSRYSNRPAYPAAQCRTESGAMFISSSARAVPLWRRLPPCPAYSAA